MLISATSFGAEKINTITGYLQLLCAFTLGMGLMREGLLDAEKPRARRGQSHAFRNIQGTAKSECPQRCYRGLPVSSTETKKPHTRRGQVSTCIGTMHHMVPISA